MGGDGKQRTAGNDQVRFGKLALIVVFFGFGNIPYSWIMFIYWFGHVWSISMRKLDVIPHPFE